MTNTFGIISVFNFQDYMNVKRRADNMKMEYTVLRYGGDFREFMFKDVDRKPIKNCYEHIIANLGKDCLHKIDIHNPDTGQIYRDVTIGVDLAK